MLRMLAVVGAQPPQRCWAVGQAVWAKLGRHRLGWERRRALVDKEALPSLRPLCEALLEGLQTSRPLVTLDAS